MPQSVDDYWMAVEKTPECAQRIGISLGLFALIEHQLVPTLRWVANISLDQARVSLESHKHFSNKVAYIKAVCDAVQPDWQRDSEVGRLFAAAATTANRIRNKYAHATYGFTGEPGVELLFVRVFADSLGGQECEEVATPQILDTEIRFLKSVIVAMKNYAEARAVNKPINLQEIQHLVSFAPGRFLRNP